MENEDVPMIIKSNGFLGVSIVVILARCSRHISESQVQRFCLRALMHHVHDRGSQKDPLVPPAISGEKIC